jgi:hypothetical protein
MFLKEKVFPSGDFDKLKASLVAGGHIQDVSSPTVQLPSVFMIAAIAAAENRNVVTIDIGGAYLNAYITSQKIVIVLDKVMTAILGRLCSAYESYVRDDGTLLVILKRTLYGYVESANYGISIYVILWEEMVTADLIHTIDACCINGKTVINARLAYMLVIFL